MATGDTIQPAYPLNTHKQDWAYYPFVGGRGAGSLTTTGVTRYSFWVDFDPFDIKNLKMVSQNVSFQIFNDSFADLPYIPYFIVDQSNDITDELVSSHLPTSASSPISIGTATINLPPSGYVDVGVDSTSAGFPPASSAVPAPTGMRIVGESGGGLAIGTTYYYVVTAVSAAVESVASSVVSFTPTTGEQTVQVYFNPVAGADFYKIYRNTTNNFTSGSLLLNGVFYAGQPPYYVDTVFTSQPTSNSFKNDQGNWSMNGYKGQGYAFGNNTMVTQGFVPQQAQLTGFYFADIFHTNTTDHTTFYNLNFEIWDVNKNFLAHLGTLNPTYNSSTLASDSAFTVSCNNVTSVNGDDGNKYWIELNRPFFSLTTPVAVTPGTKYYLVLRQATASASAYYSLGTNTNSSNVRDPYYYYPFANAHTATDGSSTWSTIVDANSKNITFPFITQGNIGRYAVTYWWATVGAGAGDYWYGTPNTNEYSFLHIDYNSRI